LGIAGGSVGNCWGRKNSIPTLPNKKTSLLGIKKLIIKFVGNVGNVGRF
jgi:hypothetical protein